MVFLEQYLERTNSKRIKRTPDEVARGLDAEGAAQERLTAHEVEIGKKTEQPQISAKKPNIDHPKGEEGKITIRLSPNAKVDRDYVGSLDGQIIEIKLDNQWYSWLYTRLRSPYNGDINLFFQHIFELGLGEIITQMVSEDRLADHVKFTTKYVEDTPR
jgi:hypothetical protein